MSSTILLTAFFVFFLNVTAFAQNNSDNWKIVVEPESIQLKIDEEIQFTGNVYDGKGNATQDSILFYSRDREAISVTPQGKLKALQAGNYKIVAVASGPDNHRISQEVEVNVEYPPLASIAFTDTPETVYSETIPLKLKITDAKGFSRDNAEISFSSSNPDVATVDKFGRLNAQ